MVNSQIESSAAGSVKAILNDTGYIDASNIKERDKFPVWDGDILVYSSKEHWNNETIRYKIPVQVKGTKNKIDKTLKYRVKMNDLYHYYNDGGVLYFVVQVDTKNSLNNKIFYRDLLPYQIDDIRNGKENQEKCYMDLKEFPKTHCNIMDLIHRFYFESMQQRPYTLNNTITISNPDNIFIPTPKSQDFQYIKNYLLNYSGTGYVMLTNGFPYPYKGIEKGDIRCVEKEKKVDIIIGDKTYKLDCLIEEKYNETQVIINKKVQFLYQEDEKVDVTLLTHSNLCTHLKNIEFLLDLAVHKAYTVNGITYNFIGNRQNIIDLKKSYIFYKRIQKAMDVVGVCSPFTLQEFSPQDIQYANILIDAFSKHKFVSLKTDIDCFILPLKICGSVIICAAFKQPNGQYKLEVIRENTPASVTNDSGKSIPVSPYMILKRDSLQNVINLDFNAFLPDIQKYGTNIEYIKVVNNFALELLSAYDASKEEILLNTAYNIIQWLDSINFDTDIETSIIHHLNLLQCKVRKQLKLTKKDKDYLRNIYKNSDETTFKFGACVILQEKDTAEEYFKQLPLDSQEKLIGVPIYTLWKGLNNG